MDKRERVLTALRGERPDRVPLGLWGHDYMRENSARELAEETIRRAIAFDWDFVKVQSRFTCFDECWGGRWRASGEMTVRPVQVAPATPAAEDLDRIATAVPDYGPLAEQLDALRLIRDGLPDGRPLIMTVFSPLMVLGYCVPYASEPRARALAMLDLDHARAARALEAVAAVVLRFARDCIAAGADGIFYASNLAGRDTSTVGQLRRYQRPYDLPILAAVAGAPCNIVHICGDQPRFAEFSDYPVASFSWAIGDGAPTLAEGRSQTGRAVVGGISTGARLRSMTPTEVEGEVRTAITSTGGAGLLLAPGCSIAADTPPASLLAAAQAAASF